MSDDIWQIIFLIIYYYSLLNNVLNKTMLLTFMKITLKILMMQPNVKNPKLKLFMYFEILKIHIKDQYLQYLGVQMVVIFNLFLKFSVQIWKKIWFLFDFFLFQDPKLLLLIVILNFKLHILIQERNLMCLM